MRPPAAQPAPANDVIEIPLHGRIAAGVPIEALEGQTMLPVPAALLGAGEHYALEVSGDSMIEAGILDGDYALIRRTDAARDGEIVVALVRGEEATLKYLRRENGTCPPRSRQFRLRTADLRSARSGGARQAGGAAAPLSLRRDREPLVRRIGR